MADYTTSKLALGDVWKVNQVETSWTDLEPLVTVDKVKTRYLFGIPLYSFWPDPVTKKKAPYTDDMIRDDILGAVSDAELETHIDIFPRKYNERHPFDRAEYQAWGYFRVRHRPAYSLDKLVVQTSNLIDVFTVPLEWTETGMLQQGQINMIPMGVALSGSGDPNSNGVVGGQSAGGAAFLAILGNQPWIAAFWRIDYTTGFPNALVPRPVNDLIGVIAAMRVLSQLAANRALVQSASLGIDGMSQSASTPGPMLYKTRMEELAQQRALYVKKLKTMYGTSLFSGDVG